MGLLLKEALKCLCGENQWSYAVFWKFGCRNPTILVWEECHYEPARYSSLLGISGVENTEMLLKEWEELGSFPETQIYRLGCQVEDQVCSLIKIMMTKQVHVVGEGIVGRAAFTGSHLWILRENGLGDGHPSEVMAEVNRQFSAGMQTVTVIPVLPHGVVQLASTSTIMENMGFVDHVKTLFAQLGSVPGAVSSNDYVKKDTCQKIGGPISLGAPVLEDQTSCKMEKFALPVGDNLSQQILTSQASGFPHESSYSLFTQNQDNMLPNTSTLQTSSGLVPSSEKTLNELIQAVPLPLRKSNVPPAGWQEAASTGSEVFPSSSAGRFNQKSSLYHPCSGFAQQTTLGQQSISCSGLTFMERQILSGNGSRGPVNHSLPASSNTATEVRSIRAGVSNYLKSSGTASLLGESVLPNSGNCLQTLTSDMHTHSIPYLSADVKPHCIPQEGSGGQFYSSNTKAVPLSTHANQSKSTSFNRGSSHQNHSSDRKGAQTEFFSREHGMEKDLFQAIYSPSVNQDCYIFYSGTTPAVIPDCMGTSQECGMETAAPQHVSVDACVRQSSGEDLFDVLGLDFKSKLLCGTASGFLMPGSDPNLQSSGTDVSVCPMQMDAGSDFYVTNDGISESRIFSEDGTDHLLDAVVSKVHATKQKSDDNVSCRTTVTKLSSNSVISDAPTSGHVSMSNRMKMDMFGLPPPPTTAELVRSSSFKSGCSVDTAGGSQTNPIYRSQISLWMEDGQNLKQENSISTANSKRADETGKANRKRLRPGESPRPRPKDRQMIQDRVKELREIVPNGAKCSIDALLERTIKHMLFLQGVTKHADKLKQSGESKIISGEGRLLMKDKFEGGGATWAYEVGSQSIIYPIIVEDLNAPRQMLVEMLCEDRGSFLEIADIIRGLGLTILKGVMEAQNDKVWAHFAVEANRDVTRMEIFLSLVQLLERAGKGSSPSLKGIDSSSLMVQNSINQTSIPATGPCNSLQ